MTAAPIVQLVYSQQVKWTQYAVFALLAFLNNNITAAATMTFSATQAIEISTYYLLSP